jgi:AcrR family transcriptional regulator
LSTSVDKKTAAKRRRPRSSAAQTRERVLKAARLAFCGAGFEHVGVREIAASAGTDPALVIRLFGSKEALFALVAESAFGLEPAFEGSLEQLGQRVAAHLLGPLEAARNPEDFDEFQFLLRSAASPIAAPILSASLHASFVAPLAKRLGTQHAAGRAALITAYVLGFSTLRFAIGSPALEATPRKFLLTQLGDAIQACLK